MQEEQRTLTVAALPPHPQQLFEVSHRALTVDDLPSPLKFYESQQRIKENPPLDPLEWARKQGIPFVMERIVFDFRNCKLTSLQERARRKNQKVGKRFAWVVCLGCKVRKICKYRLKDNQTSKKRRPRRQKGAFMKILFAFLITLLFLLIIVALLVGLAFFPIATVVIVLLFVVAMVFMAAYQLFE